MELKPGMLFRGTSKRREYGPERGLDGEDFFMIVAPMSPIGYWRVLCGEKFYQVSANYLTDWCERVA